MSTYSEVSGVMWIPCKKRVSVKKVANATFIDEYVLTCVTRNVERECRIHEIRLILSNRSADKAYAMIKSFLAQCQPTHVDMSITLRYQGE